MIARIWHGWTTPENAGKYEGLLKNEVFPSIENKNVKGYRKISLYKRVLTDKVEFITLMLFDNLEAVKEFAGEEYEKAYVPPKAREILLRYDEASQHYQLLSELNY